jgi:hypothetical protein
MHNMRNDTFELVMNMPIEELRERRDFLEFMLITQCGTTMGEWQAQSLTEICGGDDLPEEEDI